MGNFVVFAALTSMAVVTLAAIGVSFYLYRWRQLLMANGTLAVVPEELVTQWRAVLTELDALRENIAESSVTTRNSERILLQGITKTSESINTLFESTTSYQAALDTRDAEIHRFKRGYDTEVFRKFLVRFIRVRDVLSEDHQQIHPSELLAQALRLFDDALDECGVEQFCPRIGEDYRDAAGVADNPKIVVTSDSDKSFQIAEILEPGYRLRGAKDTRVIKPARVCIFLPRSQGA